MPRVYRRKTYKKRAPAKRKYNGRRRKPAYKQSRNAVLGLGFPKMIKITHKYHDTINVVCTSGIVQSQIFRANGLNDPDYTGSGHQPLFFDEMASIYDHYTVIGSKIKVTFAPSTATTQPCMVGIYTDDDVATLTNVSNIIEQGTTKYLCTGFDQTPKTLTCGWSAKKVFGGSVMADSELQGTATTDPGEAQLFRLFVRSMDGISTAGIWANVTIEYIAVWNELKTIVSS